MTHHFVRVLLFAVLAASAVSAQVVSKSAARVLGQDDLRRSSFNRVNGSELYNPGGVAVDTRDGVIHVFVSDSSNHRVLGWRDAAALQNGQPADIVLGQPSSTQGGPLGIGFAGFNSPAGLAVDPSSGDLYVADSGNHRVLRFLSPFNNPSRVEPEAVLGQSDFQGRTANGGGVGPASMHTPTGLRFDSQRNLWISDSGNHRVLRYPSGALLSFSAEADLVIGQEDFETRANNSGTTVNAGGFNNPLSLDFDSQGNLYVADTANLRILVFSGPFETAQQASRVIGQADFVSRFGSPSTNASTLLLPNAVAISRTGRLYVSLAVENRVVYFNNASVVSGVAPADGVIGQGTLTLDLPNSGTFPRASASGLFNPADVAVSSTGEVFIADGNNHRVVVFPEDSASARAVLGQQSFSQNSPNGAAADSLGPVYDIVVDYSAEPFPLFASDTVNNRVFGWRSSARFDNGAPADLVIGQADFESTVANSDSARGRTPRATSLASPRGLALNDDGDLFVADAANNRVLRFPRPFAQSGRVSADLVLGQVDFVSSVSAAVSASSLSAPSDVDFGPKGQVFVSDTGNHRVLEYAPGPSNGASAVRVYGQADFETGAAATAASAQSLNQPDGIHVDEADLLYVADRGANRVLIYPLEENAPVSSLTASNVIGQADFESDGATIGPAGLAGPRKVTTGPDGRVFIADSGNNRVTIYQSAFFLPQTAAVAEEVVGQPRFDTRNPNFNTSDGQATPESLFSPIAVRTDRRGTLYVGDSGNNRIVNFLGPAATVSAATFIGGTGVAPGSLVSVFGAELSTESAQASSIPLPGALAGRYVEINGRLRAPLLFISPGQLNMQLPVETPGGAQQLIVRLSDTDEPIAGGTIIVTPTQPGLFTVSQDGNGQALAVNQDGTINSPASPAPRGSVITLYGTGQGPTSPVVADGQAAPSGPLAVTTALPTVTAQDCIRPNSMCVQVGAKFGEPLFSGLAPGFVGLWQVNVKIPEGDDVLVGDAVPVNILINRFRGNVVTVAIR